MAPTHHVESSTPAFDSKKVSVVFVLGGPGAGKGTQCANLVRDYGFTHLSAGDLLRAEQDREGSKVGEEIRRCIREGEIVPMETTVALLREAMKRDIEDKKSGKDGEEGVGRFLIDGFPRKMDQAHKFEEDVVNSLFTLYYSCTEEVLRKRLLKRGETSGREDDNSESIIKRFKTFEETSYPVIEWFQKQDKVEEIDASGTVEEVYAETRKRVDDRMKGR